MFCSAFDLGKQHMTFYVSTGTFSGVSINKLTKGALERLVASDSFTKLSAGDAVSLGFPTGMAAEAVDVVQLANNADQEALRAAGAALAKRRGDADLLVLTGGLRKAAELCF